MSKPIKEMMIEEYKNRFGDLEGALIIDIRGIEANENNELRNDLHTKDIRVSVVKNSLAGKALAGTDLEGLTSILDGPSALAYGAESVVEVARSLVDWAKKIKELDLKGAILDGEIFEGEAGVKRLSEFPTKDEAKGRIVQLILSPFQNVISAAKSPGGGVLGIVKEIQERLEKGETIAKV